MHFLTRTLKVSRSIIFSVALSNLFSVQDHSGYQFVFFHKPNIICPSHTSIQLCPCPLLKCDGSERDLTYEPIMCSASANAQDGCVSIKNQPRGASDQALHHQRTTRRRLRPELVNGDASHLTSPKVIKERVQKLPSDILFSGASRVPALHLCISRVSRPASRPSCFGLLPRPHPW